MTPVVLELGGKNPVWVDPSFDLKLAAKRIWWARTINSGQICLAPEFVLLPKGCLDKFVKQLKIVSEEFYGTKPELSSSYSGKIINKMHFERIRTMLQNTNGKFAIVFEMKKLVPIRICIIFF